MDYSNKPQDTTLLKKNYLANLLHTCHHYQQSLDPAILLNFDQENKTYISQQFCNAGD